MAAQCANPHCSSQFAFLHEGRVFVLRTTDDKAVISKRANFFGTIRRVQYAWLCDACAKKMTVVLGSDDRIQVVPASKFGSVAALIAPCLWLGIAATIAENCEPLLS